MTALQLDLTV